ncbi:MAG: enoyl-CoA hydratase-related protein [Rhodobacterales bacterium]|nr:enoyl-CoA hydratase-related protein [Rhodobacterales bacterium]
MIHEAITLTEDDGVTVLTLNRPAVMNALNRALRAELTAAIRASTARVIVITGAGRGFCAGQDLADGGSAADIDLEATLNEEYVPLLRAIVDAPMPVIAAVNGIAAGAGANLALACDVVIASEDAAFVQAFTRIGLIPDAGGTWTLPRQIGTARAMGAMLFADKITARQAADWGMIWEAVPAHAFAAHWQARARAIANGPAVAYRNVKRALQASSANALDTQLVLEARLQAECGKTDDFKEGVTAFLEKRSPVYRGR